MMEKEPSDVHDVININNMTLSDSPGEPGDLNGAHSSWEDPETETDGFGDLAALPVEECERRPTCLRCRRPQKVCLCPFLPVHPLEVSTCLYIVQHPAEESRVLRTVPLLAACLPPGKCKVLVGRRFSEERHPELAAVCRDSRTLILYPGPGAQNLEELHEHTGPEENLEEVVHEHTGPEELLHEHRGPEDNLEEVVHDHKVPEEPEAPSSTHYNVIIIDGTWSQAKDMFLRNTLLHLPKQVQLSAAVCSQYVIRTQPTNMCLSTLECAAVCLSILEHNQNIQEVLLKPLRALCSFQLQHGAQVHHSKEHLLKNGLYDKPMPKNKRKIKRMEKLVTENVCPR